MQDEKHQPDATVDPDPRSKFRITVEPARVLIAFGFIIQNIVVPNIYLDKVCRVNLNMNASSCSDQNYTLNSTDGRSMLLVDKVQTEVSTLKIYSSLINTIPSIFFVLFLGPWSDKNGRKPLMIASLVGAILSSMILVMNDYVESWPAEYLLFAELPVSISGGEATLYLAYFSYLADITTEETRTTRMSFLWGVMILSRPIGSFASRYILQYGGHLAVWCSTMGCYGIALLYIIFFIRDSRESGSAQPLEKDPAKPEENGDGCLAIIKNLWKCFSVTFKPRTGYKRACLTIILIMRCISIFSDDPFGVNYLYSRKMFGWDAPDYALFQTALCGSLALGSLVILPILSNYFKISDIAIGIISLLGDITSCIIIIFSTTPLIFYMYTITIVLGMGIVTVMNAMPSKLVPENELGHVFAVAACAESILPLIGSPTINLLYSATLEFFPACIYAFGASLDVVLITLFVVVVLLQRKDVQGKPIEIEIPNATPAVNQESQCKIKSANSVGSSSSAEI